jgi:hypothetical protein
MTVAAKTLIKHTCNIPEVDVSSERDRTLFSWRILTWESDMIGIMRVKASSGNQQSLRERIPAGRGCTEHSKCFYDRAKLCGRAVM